MSAHPVSLEEYRLRVLLNSLRRERDLAVARSREAEAALENMAAGAFVDSDVPLAVSFLPAWIDVATTVLACIAAVWGGAWVLLTVGVVGVKALVYLLLFLRGT